MSASCNSTIHRHAYPQFLRIEKEKDFFLHDAFIKPRNQRILIPILGGILGENGKDNGIWSSPMLCEFFLGLLFHLSLSLSKFVVHGSVRVNCFICCLSDSDYSHLSWLIPFFFPFLSFSLARLKGLNYFFLSNFLSGNLFQILI